MARKAPDDDRGPGSPAWMATFSDLMNLLLCFFVLLFSMSTVDADKWEQLVASFNNTFSVFDAGASAIGDGTLISNGVSQLNELSNYINSTGVGEDVEDPTSDVLVDAGNDGETDEGNDGETDISENTSQILEEIEELQTSQSEQMAEDIEEMLAESNLDREIDIDFTSQYVQLTFKGAFLFDSGSATLKADSMATLAKVGEILETYAQCLIEIEGHTDNQPTGRNSAFASNDELSSARALAVFEYMISNTLLDPANLKHSGRGEYIPVADNATAEGRQKNRRVEIKIYNTLSSY